jgi:hypothetical protein
MYIHGLKGYKTHKCRCDECRAAWATYMRDWSAKNADSVKAKRAARAARDWQAKGPDEREAERDKQRVWMAANPDKVAASRERARSSRAERRRTDPEFRAYEKERYKNSAENLAVNSRRHLLKKKYGLSLEKFDEMTLEQGNACAICLKDQGGTRMHVDHDHATGLVRALLCTRCNVGLGIFEDETDRILRAASYLEAYRQGEI